MSLVAFLFYFLFCKQPTRSLFRPDICVTLLQLPDRVPYHFEKVFVLMINMAKDFLRFKQLFYTTFKVYNVIRLSSRISLFLCFLQVVKSRSNQSEVFLGKGVLKIYSKFTGENPYRSAKQLYWHHSSAWVFSCKFAAYFQNTFL